MFDLDSQEFELVKLRCVLGFKSESLDEARTYRHIPRSRARRAGYGLVDHSCRIIEDRREPGDKFQSIKHKEGAAQTGAFRKLYARD